MHTELKTRFTEEFATLVDSVYGQQAHGMDQRLHQACRYSLLGPGKRVRPFLLFMCNQLFGGSFAQAFKPACAVEFIHTYSLVHDDLPLMDNDDYRRGRLTTHKQYDEATALLVGDCLLNDAFILLLEHPFALAMLKELNLASGSRGMILGQSLDMQWTGQGSYTLEDLKTVHQLKTGRLLACACVLGALSAGVQDPQDLARMRSFGENIGLCFQIIDDCLDDSAQIGKTKGKDKAQGKLTFLSLMPMAEAKDFAKHLSDQALACLKPYESTQGKAVRQLEEYVMTLLTREL